MRSLSEMERCVECIANSRRVRVQTKEKELEENGGKRWNEMKYFSASIVCVHSLPCLSKCYTITHRLIIQTHKELLTSYEEQRTIDRYFHLVIPIIKR